MRASVDQAPGPNNASAAATAAASRNGHGSPGREKAIQSSTMAESEPVIGVQSPASKRTPAPAATIAGTARPTSGAPVSTAKQSRRRNTATATRRIINPLPGGPSAN